MWALFALTAALLTSFLPIINKRILTTVDVVIVAWVPNALSVSMLLAVTLALIGWSSVDRLFLLRILASGILNLVATLASIRALQLADASVATPFLSFNPAFTLLLSVFTLREVPSVRGIVGVMLIVVGAYLFQVKEVGKGILAPLRALVCQPGVLQFWRGNDLAQCQPYLVGDAERTLQIVSTERTQYGQEFLGSIVEEPRAPALCNHLELAHDLFALPSLSPARKKAVTWSR
jgi:uncharacterized membrane protein